MTRIYLAGPMRGYPDHNFPAFAAAAASLRADGHDVVLPHEKDLLVPGFDPSKAESVAALDMAETMRWDLRAVLDCDAIVMLDGWERSAGARLERCVAESTGRNVYLFAFGQLIQAEPWAHELVFVPGRRLLAAGGVQ